MTNSSQDLSGILAMPNFKEVVDSIPVALFVKDRNSKIILMNRACEDQWGMSLADIRGTDASQYFPVEQMEGFLAIDRDIFAKGKQIECEEKFWNAKLKEDRIGLTIKKPIYRPDGTPELLLGITIDVTDRMRTEAHARESNEKLRGLYEMSPLGIALTDMNGRYIEFNEGFRKICGYSIEELRSLDYWALTPKEYQSQEERQLATLRATGHYGPYEKEYIRKSGERIPLQLNGMLVNGQDGQKYIWSIVEDITKRKESELALREKTTLLENVINSSADYIFVKDRNLRTILCNKIFAQALGKDPEELYEKTDIENGWDPKLVLGNPAEGIHGFQQDDLAVLAGDSVFSHDDLGNVGGEVRNFDSSKVPLRQKDGTIVGLIGISRDVTERIQTEKALRASEARLLDAQAAANIGSWETDLISLKVSWSAQTYKIFDLDPQTFQPTHSSFLEFVHPHDRAAVDAAFFQSFTHANWNSIEHRVVSAKGRTKHVQERWRVEFDDAGKPARAVGTCQDITELKSLYEAQRQIADRLTLATRAGGVGTWDYDIVANTILWDEAMYGLYGIASGQFGGAYEAWRNGVHPEDMARGDEEIQQAIRGEKEFDTQFRVLWPDGTIRTIRAMAKVHRDSQGKALRMVGTNWDITEQILNEKALQASVREKEALLKEVHHRVKNNLQVITSLLRLESRRNENDNTKTVLGEMQARIRAMALLHESLYRSGTFASIDLGSYLKKLATQAFQTQVTSSGAVRLELNVGSVQVGMDQAIPCGLLVNELISNCLKHGFPAGATGHVGIELHPLDTPKQWRLRVIDTGVGLPENFEEKRKSSLGLQLVDDLSRQIGGELIVTANQGRGAEFTVNFRAIEPAPLVMPT